MRSDGALPVLVPIMVALVAWQAGCGGASFTDLGSLDGSPGDGATATNDSGAPGEAGDNGNDATVLLDGGSVPPADAPAPVCPDVTGAYSINIVDGSGCGNFNDQASQCIRAAQVSIGCDVTFVSLQVSGGSPPAINGAASIQVDGSFSGAALREGTTNRTGCTGAWDATTSTMTVDCGGTGTQQSCVVALTRTRPRCI